jgi:hypothetical protein
MSIKRRELSRHSRNQVCDHRNFFSCSTLVANARALYPGKDNCNPARKLSQAVERTLSLASHRRILHRAYDGAAGHRQIAEAFRLVIMARLASR